MRRRRIAIWSTVCVALLFGTVAGLHALSGARRYQLFGRLVADVPLRDSLVALTFDDGPAAGIIDSILPVLQRHGAGATFFVTGHGLATNPDVGRRLVAAGYELGNHSYSHARMLFMSPDSVRAELGVTDSLIRAAGERGPIYFRPPYGVKLVSLPWVLSRTDRTTIMWDLEPDSYPAAAASADGIVRHVMQRVHPGTILLLHVWWPSRATSRAALSPLLDSLHTRGYRVVSVRQLLTAAGEMRTP